MRTSLRRPASWHFVCCAALLVAACSKDSTAPSDPPVTTIAVAVAPATVSLVEGGAPASLTATVTTSAGIAAAPNVVWTSADPSIATVSGTGTSATVTAVAPGATTITATSSNVTGTATVVVTHAPKTVTVQIVGGGAITSQPAGVTCTGGTCAGAFPHGTVVQLQAAPNNGNRVRDWTGACTGNGGSCTLTLDRAQATTVAFEPKVDSSGLTPEINALVPDSVITRMKAQGLPIFGGATPPSIEGSYFASPVILRASSVPNDRQPGARFTDANLRFSNQDNNRMTLTTDYVSGLEEGTGLSGFIVGTDSSFTVFSRLTVVVRGDTAFAVFVVSGKLRQGGIAELYVANFMLDNRGNPSGYYIPVNTGRVLWDSDRWSPQAAFPRGVLRTMVRVDGAAAGETGDGVLGMVQRTTPAAR